MFRISQFMRELVQPTPNGSPRRLTGPVVIWNLVRRCNLTCRHCYSVSADRDFPGELGEHEIDAVMEDLRQFGVSVLVLSGGEPLLRPDLLRISQRAKAMGFYVGLSSNGTLIDEANIDAIAAVNYDYVGISIDGMRNTHDRFRRQAGAFEAARRGIRLCRERGIKVGLRFTLTEDNAAELPEVLAFMHAHGGDKFYLSHLNYAGRGHRHRNADAVHQTTRQAMDGLFEHCWQQVKSQQPGEYVTGNNDADGVYLLHWVQRRFPDKVDHLYRKLVAWGGNASGINIANIDNLGHVHPDTFWGHHSLGNVRERPFSAIWQDRSDPLMAGLNRSPRPVQGRCARCQYLNICGGNTRVRAYQLTGNIWAEDPGCYLTDDEIGLPASSRLNDLPPSSPLQETG
ncbi:MAG: heme d1 biosynthesis radical SAM protein NirJ [Gammaproteobacteria bacterium]